MGAVALLSSRTGIALSIGAVHLVISIALLAWSFTLALGRNVVGDVRLPENGRPAVSERLVHRSAEALLSPVAHCVIIRGDCGIVDRYAPALLRPALIPLNSVFWGLIAWLLVSAFGAIWRRTLA